MLLVMGTCRRPGVPFWSFISFTNRKTKLTDTGGKLYIAVCLLIMAGAVAQFARPGHVAGPAASRDAMHDIEQAGSAAQETLSADEYKLAQFNVEVREIAISSELIASFIPVTDYAGSFLETCSEYSRRGMDEWKSNGRFDRMQDAAKQCRNAALNLCTSPLPSEQHLCTDFLRHTQNMGNRNQ